MNTRPVAPLFVNASRDGLRDPARALGVVIPTLNCAATLTETLLSVARVPAIARVIVADSGSTDGTLEIAEAAGVEVIKHAPQGMYAAINMAIHQLDTPWVSYINGDDILRSNGITSLLQHASSADILYGPVDFVTADGSFIHCWHSASPRSLLPLYRAGVSPLLQQGTLFRRVVFETLAGFDTQWRFVADADFWFRAANRGYRFRQINHPPVAAFRMHSGQQSQNHAREMREEFRRMSASHGAQPNSPLSRARLLGYRLAHARAYTVRCLRRADLTGRCRLAPSYDLGGGAS